MIVIGSAPEKHLQLKKAQKCGSSVSIRNRTIFSQSKLKLGKFCT